MSLRVGAAAGIDELEKEWDELSDRLSRGLFTRPGWVAAWWKAFGDGRLRIFTARRGSVLVGVLPMYELRRTLRSPTNPQTPVFDVLAEDEEVARSLLAGVFDSSPRRVELSYVPSDGWAALLLPELATARRYRVKSHFVLASPYVRIDKPWDTYEQQLSGNMRANLRRREKLLHREGDVTFETRDGTDDLDALLDEGFRVEAAGWKGTEGTAILSDPATTGFYRDMAHWARDRGWLCLGFLRLDGTVIGFDLSLETETRHYLIKTGYDSEYSRFSPGLLLRKRMIRRAFVKKLQTYEFLGDNNEWKQSWTRTVRPRATLKAFAPTVGGYADYVSATDNPLAQRLRTAVSTILRR
jgi:CelD/BcsL family acetyltransferase involved in cellulose biosynthesis